MRNNSKMRTSLAAAAFLTITSLAAYTLHAPITRYAKGENAGPGSQPCQSVSGSPPTFTADNAYYCMTWNDGFVMQGPFGAGNNTFGANGQTHSQTMTISASTFPNGTSWSWSWPRPRSCCSVDAFYQVIFGPSGFAKIGGEGAPWPSQIKNIRTLTATLNASYTDTAVCFGPQWGNWVGNIDIIWDIFLFGNATPYSPGGAPLFEIEIAAHDGPPQQSGITYKVNENGRTWTGYYYAPSGPQNWKRWYFTTGSDVLLGTVDLNAILQSLMVRGYATGHEYIVGIPFGAEVWCGTGSLTISSISFRWES